MQVLGEKKVAMSACLEPPASAVSSSSYWGAATSAPFCPKKPQSDLHMCGPESGPPKASLKTVGEKKETPGHSTNFKSSCQRHRRKVQHGGVSVSREPPPQECFPLTPPPKKCQLKKRRASQKPLEALSLRRMSFSFSGSCPNFPSAGASPAKWSLETDPKKPPCPPKTTDPLGISPKKKKGHDVTT